jgi:hypothetical protein
MDISLLLIWLPWLLGPLLVARYDLWRVEVRSVDGFEPVNRKLMEL